MEGAVRHAFSVWRPLVSILPRCSQSVGDDHSAAKRRSATARGRPTCGEAASSEAKCAGGDRASGKRRVGTLREAPGDSDGCSPPRRMSCDGGRGERAAEQ